MIDVYAVVRLGDLIDGGEDGEKIYKKKQLTNSVQMYIAVAVYAHWYGYKLKRTKRVLLCYGKKHVS